MGGDESLEIRDPSADDLTVRQLVAILEGHEGRDRANAEELSNIRRIVDVDFSKDDAVLFSVLSRVLLELGRDHVAGTAPGSPEVNDDGLAAVDELREVSLVLDFGGHCYVGRRVGFRRCRGMGGDESLEIRDPSADDLTVRQLVAIPGAVPAT